MRLLPVFSDLMLLPRVIDAQAHVTIEQDQQIHVRTEMLDTMVDALTHYPNIRVDRVGRGELVIQPVPLQAETILVYWPDGRRLGLQMYDRYWGNYISAEAVDSMFAAGIRINILKAQQDEDLRDVINRYHHKEK